MKLKDDHNSLLKILSIINNMKIYKISFSILWFLLYFYILFNKELQSYIYKVALISPYLSPLMLAVMQIIFALLFLPCSIFSVLFGLLWGFELGFIFSIIAALLSSSCTFYAGRYIKVYWFVREDLIVIEKILSLIAKYKWKSSLIAHINPLLPGSSIGFIFGSSNIKFRYFITGALLGLLPLQFILIFSATNLVEYL